MISDELKMTAMLKVALEFNAAVIATATQVFTAKHNSARTVHRDLSRQFEEYHKKINAILNSEK